MSPEQRRLVASYVLAAAPPPSGQPAPVRTEEGIITTACAFGRHNGVEADDVRVVLSMTLRDIIGIEKLVLEKVS